MAQAGFKRPPNSVSRLCDQDNVVLRSALFALKPRDGASMNLQYAHSTAPSETGPLVSRNDDIAKADLAEYLNDNAIQTEFQDAVKLARRHFPKSKLSWSLESDPDCEGRWVELDIAEAASPDDAMSRYDTLISDWTAAANPRVDGMIRFTINLS